MLQKSRQIGKIASLAGLPGLLAEGEINMSETQSGSKSNEVQINKKVGLVGYISIDEDVTARDVMIRMGDGDYSAKEYKGKTEYHIVVGGQSKKIYNAKLWERLNDADTGELELVEKQKQRTSYKKSGRDFCEELMEETVNPTEFPAELSWGPEQGVGLFSSFRDEDYNKVVRLKLDTVNTGLLYSHEDIESMEEPWEDEDADCVAVKIDVIIDVDSREKLEEIDVAVVEPIVNAMVWHDDIERVSIEKCENEVVEQGTCLNI